MHIAASSPRCVSRDEVSSAELDAEREVLSRQAAASGKPQNVIDKMVEGRLDKFYSQICLLEQPYIKDMNITVEEYIKQSIGVIGENIQIRRFTRYQLGEDI